MRRSDETRLLSSHDSAGTRPRAHIVFVVAAKHSAYPSGPTGSNCCRAVYRFVFFFSFLIRPIFFSFCFAFFGHAVAASTINGTYFFRPVIIASKLAVSVARSKHCPSATRPLPVPCVARLPARRPHTRTRNNPFLDFDIDFLTVDVTGNHTLRTRPPVPLRACFCVHNTSEILYPREVPIL